MSGARVARCVDAYARRPREDARCRPAPGASWSVAIRGIRNQIELFEGAHTIIPLGVHSTPQSTRVGKALWGRPRSQARAEKDLLDRRTLDIRCVFTRDVPCLVECCSGTGGVDLLSVKVK